MNIELENYKIFIRLVKGAWTVANYLHNCFADKRMLRCKKLARDKNINNNFLESNMKKFEKNLWAKSSSCIEW